MEKFISSKKSILKQFSTGDDRVYTVVYVCGLVMRAQPNVDFQNFLRSDRRQGQMKKVT